MNFAKVVSVIESGIRIAERTAFAAVGTWAAQNLVPMLAQGGTSAQTWKQVFIAGGLAAVHAEVGSLMGALKAWAAKQAPATSSANSVPATGGAPKS